MGIPGIGKCARELPIKDSATPGGKHWKPWIVLLRVSEGGSASYSGCQTMWDEKGNQVFVLTFEQGNVIKFESNDPSDASSKQSCRYEHGKLARNESKDCLDYGRVKDGFGPLPNSDDPIVPPERDPRR